MYIRTIGCCIGRQIPWISWSSRISDWKSIHKFSCNTKMSNPSLSHQGTVTKHWVCQESWRIHSMPLNMEEYSSMLSEDEDDESDGAQMDLAHPFSSDEMKLLLADSERQRLIKKLSEANQHNRFLKRQLQAKDDALINFKSELAVMELEIQALVKLAEEIAQSGITEGSRKINGKYIQSHLLSRFEAVHEKLKEQIKDVDAAKSKEVHIFWIGMAERNFELPQVINVLPKNNGFLLLTKLPSSVQLMGSFDGWSQGEDLSPEYDGSFTKFATTLMLRPGRYEIKFLVDGVWQLSPEYPTVGEGLTKNNLLIVE